MGDNNPDDRLAKIADNSTFDVEELEAMDDETVNKIEASLELDQNDGGDGTGDGSGAGDDTDHDSNIEKLVETVEEQNQKIEALEQRLEDQDAERRDQLVDAITSQTRFDEDDLDDLGIAEDVDKLEQFAEKQGATVNSESFFGGRAAGVDDGGDEFEVEVDGYWTNEPSDDQEAAD